MRSFIIIVFLLLYSVTAEDRFGVKGEGWAAWKNLEKTILENKEQEATDLCSGRMRQGFFRFGMENIVNETKSMKPEFIREFTNKANDTLYLIAEIQGRITALIFKKKNKTWLFDDQTEGNFTLPEEAEKWRELGIIRRMLSEIGQRTHYYFANKRDSLVLPNAEAMGISPMLLNYTNPENDQQEEFLLVKGVNYKASPDLLLAISQSPIFGKHYACFEDGTVMTVSKEFFEENKEALGLLDTVQTEKYSAEMSAKLKALLKKLAADNYRERKEARQELQKIGPKAIPFLTKYKNHNDVEVKFSIREILRSFKEKAFRTRPKYEP